MNCDKCLNRGDCEDCGPAPKEPDFFFHVGEVLTLKGRLFKVKSVKPKEIRLKLWKKTTKTFKTPRGEE
jgi:uncharacterized Zn finger protein